MTRHIAPPFFYFRIHRVKRPLRESTAENLRVRSKSNNAITAEMSEPMNAITLKTFVPAMIAKVMDEGMSVVEVRVVAMVVVMTAVAVTTGATVIFGATVGAIVGAEVAATAGATATGADWVAVGAGGRGAPASAGIVSVLPTLSFEFVVRLFASRINLYFVPSLYIFCAMIQGLSPETIVYVRSPASGARVPAGALVAAGVFVAACALVVAASAGKVGMKIGVGKTYGALVGSSPCARTWVTGLRPRMNNNARIEKRIRTTIACFIYSPEFRRRHRL
jgi:hypothetical protein